MGKGKWEGQRQRNGAWSEERGNVNPNHALKANNPLSTSVCPALKKAFRRPGSQSRCPAFLLKEKPPRFPHSRVSITIETQQSNLLSSKRVRGWGGARQPQLPANHSLHPRRAGSSRGEGTP